MSKGRAPCCDKSKVKRGPWSTEEDLRLVGFIQKNGHSNWRALPKHAGLLRCGKSCRLRWVNYLRPDVKRGNFTPDEEQTIINLHNSIGNKWSKIASYLPGRTDNEIKNVWNTHLKKRLTRKNSNSKSDSQKDGADDSKKMDCSASPSSCSSSSLTVSGSDPNMEKTQDFQESEIKKPDEVPEPKEATNPDSVKNQDSAFPESSIINNDQKNSTGDEKIEIPFDSDIDFWEMLDSLDPLQEQIGEIQSSSLEKFDCDVECSRWLSLLEGEVGLTTDIDNLPNQKHLEIDLEPKIGHELDYIPTLNGSSENISI